MVNVGNVSKVIGSAEPQLSSKWPAAIVALTLGVNAVVLELRQKDHRSLIRTIPQITTKPARATTQL